MSSKTKNYELHKIDLNDAPPDITVLNQNWDKLDTKLKEVNDLIEQINKELEQLPEFSAVEGVSVTLTTNWREQSNGTFAQTITVPGVTADNEVVVDCNLSGTDIDADIAVLEAWGCVNRASQATNSLTFYCYGDTPTVTIPLNVVVM